MPRAPMTLARRAMLWFFEYPPFSPYVSFSASVDFSAAKDYLAELNAQTGVRVSVQHLLTAAIARTYVDFPSANAAVIEGRIERFEQVNAVVPVNLLDTGVGNETSLALIERAQSLSLRELAERTRRQVKTEREGAASNAFQGRVRKLLQHLPTPVVFRALDAAEALTKIPGVARRAHALFPVTISVSNVGSSLPLPAGGLSRGGAFQPAHHLFSLGSVLGVFPMQDEVRAVEGQALVRPCVPFMYTFDHRLFDGVLAGRIISRFCEILAAPAGVFGEDGELYGPTELR